MGPKQAGRCYFSCMQFTLCKQSALAVLRSLRATGQLVVPPSGSSTRGPAGKVLLARADILPPDPAPRKRWTRGLIDGIDLGLPFEFGGKRVDFAVPDGALRIRARDTTWTVYADGIPKEAFIRMRCGVDDCLVAISGPELLFAELAKEMHPVELLTLGHELCGSFSRDASDPYNGPITYGVRPVTSVERIRSFLDEARGVRGLDVARETSKYLNDSAWSPTESLVAALLRLPADSLGFDFGELVLNERISPSAPLPGAAESRVPDIMIAETSVGLNYDGAAHLDLGSIVNAARGLEANPELVQAQVSLANAVRSVRAKVVDDIRRNRELAAGGLAVFPIVKEDLYTKGGFEQIVAHLIDVIEQSTDRDMSEQKEILGMKRLSDARRHMILSLLPGSHERNIHVARFINGNEVAEGPRRVSECWVEL